MEQLPSCTLQNVSTSQSWGSSSVGQWSWWSKDREVQFHPIWPLTFIAAVDKVWTFQNEGSSGHNGCMWLKISEKYQHVLWGKTDEHNKHIKYVWNTNIFKTNKRIRCKHQRFIQHNTGVLISPQSDQEGTSYSDQTLTSASHSKKKKFRKLSVQPGLRCSNDLCVGRIMATFQLFFQSGRAKDLSAPLY